MPISHHRSQFDTVLPPDAYAELQRPKRPALLRRPVYRNLVTDRSGLWKWIGAFVLTVILLAGVIGHYTQQQQQQSPAVALVHPRPTPIVPPTPARPTPSQPASPIAPIQSAPKATLIGVPLPQAAVMFPPGRTPMWRQTGDHWTIWQPRNPDFIYIVDAQCYGVASERDRQSGPRLCASSRTRDAVKPSARS
jgi:hypothetical protein